MTTEAYVRDKRFEVLGCGVRWPDGSQNWCDGGAIEEMLHSPELESCAVLTHHAHFDLLILRHHYGIKPKAILDTLSMARLQLGNHVSASLESVSRHYGLAGKTLDYNRFRGRHWADLDPASRQHLAQGCLDDIALTWECFQRLSQGFPQQEYLTIDMAVRAFTEGELVGDIDVFAQVWRSEAERKKAILSDLAVTAGDLQSADRFAELLQAEGIEPEKKEGKNGEIYAFAKTDQFMVDLLEHDDERVRTLAEARLGQKSTLDQTRAERLGYMATRGPMCVYLAPFAAHTTRFGGGDKVNYQNFKRGSLLRKGHKAPSGKWIVKADKSQIECRILNYVAEQWDVIERFAQGADPYIGIASRFYGREITRADPAERGVGKQLELSCGYGAGASTIVRTAKRGTYGPPVELTEAQGLAARDLYRSTHPGVVAYWKQASRLIAAIGGTNASIQWGPLLIQTGVISLEGIPIWYPELHYHRQEDGEGYWRYKSRKGWVKLYGGKLVENVVQFMSAVDMRESLARIYRRTGIRYSSQEHDAAIWCVPEKLIGAFEKVVEEEMTRAPTWLPDIPLACDISISDTM